MKVLLIIAQVGFQDVEYKNTRKVLEENRIEVETASISKETAKGKYGMELVPDTTVKDAILDGYDMIVVIGGPGAPKLAEYEEVMDLLKRGDGKKRLIGAICIAPAILAKAGILKGKRATVWTSKENKEAIEIIEEHGAEFVDEPVVVDGRIITANGPEAAEDFGKGIVEMIKGR
ncbi:hypothetical protein GF327_08270 [Candidatus Woesearchaeota archaeon]|nr:hypothetical protein [Candidatus Woesearchaeota archaeon]